MVYKELQINKIKKFTDSAPGRALLIVLGGALTGLTLVFPQIGFLEWISIVPAAYALIKMTRGGVSLPRIYACGLLFFMSFYLVVYHWFIYLYPLEFTGMSRGAAVVVVLAGWVGLSILQSLTGAFVFVFCAMAGNNSWIRKRGILLPFLTAAAWAAFEFSQTLFWTGVPWGRLPIGQSEMPLMLGTASLFGSYGITILIVSVNFVMALAICDLKKCRICSICAVVMIALNLAAGMIIMPLTESRANDDSIRAALIQANIGSADKWDMETTEIIEIYEDYTRRAAAEGPDIIIWPESAMPVVLEHSPKLTGRLCALAVECGVPILVGILTSDEQENEYNSLVLFTPDGGISEEVYSKRHLVPFGEYIPLRDLITTIIPPLSQIGMLEDDVTPGEDSGLIEYNGVTYGSLICFDSIYEELTRQSVIDGAGIIVISTNDSWFLDSAAGRMHNAQAKLRAVESGRYVLRAANTGISSVITPSGDVIDMLEPLVGGYIIAEVGTRSNMTLYMTTGNLPILLIALVCVCFMLYETVIRFRRRFVRSGSGVSSESVSSGEFCEDGENNKTAESCNGGEDVKNDSNSVNKEDNFTD